MNKKIFTLLAGAFLGFAAGPSVTAQAVNVLETQKLRVKPYNKKKSPLKFKAGENDGYYYLQLDSMVTYNKTTGQTVKNLIKDDGFAAGIPELKYGTIRKGLTLYMGPDKAGQNALWIDVMGRISETADGTPPVSDTYPNASMALESAAGLWCVTIQDYSQGQNPTFDFTNKLQKRMLEVNVYGHEAWAKDPDDGWRMSGYLTGGNTNAQTPGSIGRWEFSETYATGVTGGRPLVAYLDNREDTVAVLVGDVAQNGLGYVQIKIAPATDVAAGKINGMLLFTLKESMPFALDKKSFQTVLGTESAQEARALKFSPNGTPNPFTSEKWEPEYLTHPNASMLIDSSAWTNKWETNYRAWDVAPISQFGNAGNPWFEVKAQEMGAMGYLLLKNKNTNKHLYVDTFYYNTGNSQFLKFATGECKFIPKNPMLGQFAWRLVYYPSGDSIYINPFSATYVPTYDPKAITDSTRFATDSVVRSWYTFTAYPTPKLMADILPDYKPGGGGEHPALQVPLEECVSARLKWGVNPMRATDPLNSSAGAPTRYRYYHRLYVDLQNLTGTARVTLHNGNEKNGKISTRVHFGCYDECKVANSDRATIEPDLYLIRNEKGQYLQVPLHSAEDSAIWVTLKAHEHPEELPSFHWIVEKRYRNSNSSPINIINREFGQINRGGKYAGDYGLAFLDIQLKKDQHAPFKARTTKIWKWNNEKVNSNVIDFEKTKNNMSAKNAPTFIRLPMRYKNNPNLGYQYFNVDTASVNRYAFNFRAEKGADGYLSVSDDLRDATKYKEYVEGKGVADTLVYITGNNGNCFSIGYFRIDTVKSDAGAYKPYGYGVKNGKADADIWKNNQVDGLVQLKRQAYTIKLMNPYKYCLGSLHLGNTENEHYAFSRSKPYKEVLGRPLFFFRDAFMEPDGIKNFAMVQIIDVASVESGSVGSSAEQFEKYLIDTWGKQLAAMVMNKLKNAGEFNPGVFVAAMSDYPNRLVYQYRFENSTRTGYFRLKKDADPIYRRFNTEYEGSKPGDEPETVKFYTKSSSSTGKDYLYENTGALTSTQAGYSKKNMSFLGLLNIHNLNEQLAADKDKKIKLSTAIYVDTAYVNRGTGHIKPQYMLMVDPQVVEDTLVCDDNGDHNLPAYTRGRYLINAKDSAKIDENYLWKDAWARLVFTDAIHANDALYILGGVDLKNIKNLYKKDVIDVRVLDEEAKKAGSKIRKIDLGNNFHKDCVFSFRLVERPSCGSQERGGDFVIESETTDRGKYPVIAPCDGGWIKIHNHVPVLSSSSKDGRSTMVDGEIFNVEPTDEQPVANEVTPAVTEVKVVAENGAVTILNAAGKKVVVSNVLGQMLVNTVLTSDRATVAAPQGVVVVAVEGEAAVKAMVK